MEQDRLPLKVKLGFGVCDVGGSLFFTVIAFWLLNFLTDTVLIAPSLAGTVILVGRIWDAVTDPVFGYVSDRTNTRWGRRRPYMLFGSVPLFLGMIVMFTNPALFMGEEWTPGSHQTLLCIWGVASICLLSTAFTSVNIPYNALTPELTRDYHERTSLNGYRFVFAVFGMFMGSGLVLPLVNIPASKDTGFVLMAAIPGAVMMITALITVATVREPIMERITPSVGFFKTYFHVFTNGPYVLILLTWTFHTMAITVVSGILIYYFKYIHAAEGKTTLALLIFLGMAVAFIPLSVLLSRRIGKKAVYTIGMLTLSTVVVAVFFLAHDRSIGFTFAMMAGAGVGMGLIYPMPFSIVPDAIEYDYLKTKNRNEGAFYGIWTFLTKVGQALAIGVMGWTLSLSGFIANQPQAESAILGIRILVGPVTALFFLLGVLALAFYPITEKRYAEILSAIDRMESERAT